MDLRASGLTLGRGVVGGGVELGGGFDILCLYVYARASRHRTS